MSNHPSDSGSDYVRAARPVDAANIARIYNYYIAETIVSFEVDAVSSEEMACRVEEIRSQSLPWLVAERDASVVGFAYAGPWRSRSAYRYSVEVAVYLDHASTGQGIGSKLFERLLNNLEKRGFHVAIGGIALPNDVSVALHEKFGFRKVAHYEQVGYKFDRWIDVGYWQRML